MGRPAVLAIPEEELRRLVQPKDQLLELAKGRRQADLEEKHVDVVPVPIVESRRKKLK